MIRAIYAGSFDPVTKGHLDIIQRSSRVVDELIVGVLHNRAKCPLFSVEERVKMLEEVTRELPNIKIKSFTGLLVEFAKECRARVIVRGSGPSRISTTSSRWRRPTGSSIRIWTPCF